MSSLIEKAGGLFDRYFLLGVWLPTFLATAAALAIVAASMGLAAAVALWKAMPTELQTWLPALALVGVTAVAIVLRAFTTEIVRAYEGYWPDWLQRLARRWVIPRWERLRGERSELAANDLRRYANAQMRLHLDYPARANLILPTRLGNVLRSAESYPETAYGLDGVFWWPRLTPLLPKGMQESASGAFLQVTTLLNTATLSTVIAILGPMYLWRVAGRSAWASVIVLLVGLVLARCCYCGAVAQAREFGLVVRAAFDLHRLDLLEALHLPVPVSPDAERKSWTSLEAWLYNNDMLKAAELRFVHKAKHQKEGSGSQGE